MRTGRRCVAGLSSVTQPDGYRVYPQFLCDHVKLGVNTTCERPSVYADHPSYRLVRVNAITMKSHIVHAIGLLVAQEGNRGRNGTGAGISSTVKVRDYVAREHSTFFIHSGLDRCDHRMAHTGRNGIFLPGVNDLYRPLALEGQQASDKLCREHIRSAAECSADCNLSDIHFGQRKLQSVGERLGLGVRRSVGHPDLN